MHISAIKRLFTFALALCAQPASAFLDPPYITPASPTATELVSVNIYGGVCDLADYGISWPPPVTQQGNEITILLTGVHEEDPEFCDVSVGTYTYPVGMYPRGTYNLHVNWRYSTFNGWVTETLGVIPFTVRGASQQPVETPMFSLAGLSVLLLGLIAISLLRLRERLS